MDIDRKKGEGRKEEREKGRNGWREEGRDINSSIGTWKNGKEMDGQRANNSTLAWALR